MATTTTEDKREDTSALERIQARYAEYGMVRELDGEVRLYSSIEQFRKETGSEIETDHEDIEEFRRLALEKGLTEEQVRAPEFAERLITFTASDDSQDRYGDRITVDGKLGRRTFGEGWRLENFERNPVFMPFHVYNQIPLGTAIKTWKDVGSGRRKRLRMTVAMDDGSSNPVSPLMTNAYRSGLMRSVSVGFRPLKFHEPNDDDERAELGLGPRGVVFGTQELYENSAVAIPANPNAVAEKDLVCTDMKCYLRFADEVRDVDPEFGYAVRSMIRKNVGQVYLNKLEKDMCEEEQQKGVSDDEEGVEPTSDNRDEIREVVADVLRTELQPVIKKIQDIAEGLDSHLKHFSGSDGSPPASPAENGNGHVIEEMLKWTKEASGLFGNDADEDTKEKEHHGATKD